MCHRSLYGWETGVCTYVSSLTVRLWVLVIVFCTTGSTCHRSLYNCETGVCTCHRSLYDWESVSSFAVRLRVRVIVHCTTGSTRHRSLYDWETGRVFALCTTGRREYVSSFAVGRGGDFPLPKPLDAEIRRSAYYSGQCCYLLANPRPCAAAYRLPQ